MANLIITVISIALVAAAAFIGAYYGGVAYLNDGAKANASTIMGQGTQMAAAWNAYLGDNIDTVPTSLDKLLQGNVVAFGGYLQTIPMVPNAPGGVMPFPVFVASTANGSYYAYFDAGRPQQGNVGGIDEPNAGECIAVQKTALGKPPTVLATAAQGAIASKGNGTFGCAVLSGSITNGLGGAAVPTGDLETGDYVMEYLLQ